MTHIDLFRSRKVRTGQGVKGLLDRLAQPKLPEDKRGKSNQFYNKVFQYTARFYCKGFGLRCATQDTAKPTW